MHCSAYGFKARIEETQAIVEAEKAKVVSLALKAEGILRQFACGCNVVLEDNVVVQQPVKDSGYRDAATA